MKLLATSLAKLIELLTHLSTILAGIGLAMIVGSYVFEVVMRYIFASPTSWASDFVSYALCAIVFLALPQVTKDKSHVAVTIIVDVMPKSVANAAHVVVSLLGFACLSYSAWVSLKENIRQYTRGITTLAIDPVPLWWVSSFITFGLLLSALYFLVYLSPRHRVSGFELLGKAE
ncbi:TRAP transporter small permease [Pararhodobacter sp.]|uniref:TRAP transporter small permease n=1 Tax=Pararhodobacter sp. TaxID=2127056 RepID=UPI002AFFBCC9|nr:TRAP transporter small permease subunit [Pararhodobacter sp.]